MAIGYAALLRYPPQFCTNRREPVVPHRTRYTFKSPNLSVHEETLRRVTAGGRIFVDNHKRLSVSAEIEDAQLIEQLERLGVEISIDIPFDPE